MDRGSHRPHTEARALPHRIDPGLPPVETEEREPILPASDPRAEWLSGRRRTYRVTAFRGATSRRPPSHPGR
jgi:hypothetical protein